MSGEPWFRRWLIIGFVPIRREGWLLTLAAIAVQAPIVLLIFHAGSNTLLWWLSAVAGMCTWFAFLGVVEMKMERHYGS